MQFRVKTIKNDNIKDELEKIGFDKSYIERGSLKHDFLTLKISNLPPHLSTIIKQTALSNGTDAGINREVLMNKIETSDLILSGSVSQIKKIAKSLYMQPFNLKEVAKLIEKEIELKSKKNIPLIMGILNLTEDSFSDGGKYLNPEDALSHAKKMIKNGADIIDIGAESTRPGAVPVNVDIEIKRIYEVISEIKATGVKISIDTRNHKTARKMIEAGADIINDVSGLNYDKDMVNVIKDSNAEIIVMHSRGTPLNMDNLCSYDNLADEIFDELCQKIEFLEENGISKERIITDTGFGFAKNTEQNFELLKRIKEFNSLGTRQLAGVSRKRFLKSLTDENSSINVLDEVTMLASFFLAQNKIDVIRVHNVEKTHLALEFYKKTIL